MLRGRKFDAAVMSLIIVTTVSISKHGKYPPERAFSLHLALLFKGVCMHKIEIVRRETVRLPAAQQPAQEVITLIYSYFLQR